MLLIVLDMVEPWSRFQALVLSIYIGTVNSQIHKIYKIPLLTLIIVKSFLLLENRYSNCHPFKVFLHCILPF